MKTKIKICGLTREADIAFVNEAKPDYMGFVFAKSRRQITFEQAQKLRALLDPAIIPVGVFVDAPIADIANLYTQGIISIAQLHGNEDARYIADLKHSCDVPLIKALSDTALGTVLDEVLEQFAEADYLLFDSGKGGTGTSFDWSRLGFIARPWFLAGGINEQNIKAAMALKPFAVDVSSGAETDGLKDGAKIARLVRAVREFGAPTEDLF